MTKDSNISAKILYVTGYPPTSGKLAEIVDMENPSLTCNNLQDFPVERWYTMGGLLDGKPLICGGFYPHSADCYQYDQTWNPTIQMNKERSNAGYVTMNDGSLWITGGRVPESLSTLTTELIHPNGSVTYGPDLPNKRSCHCSAKIDDHRIVLAGDRISGASTVIYDSTTKTFTDGPDMRYSRCYASCAVFRSAKHGGRPVLIAAATGIVTDIWDFENSNAWEAGPNLQSNGFSIGKLLPNVAGDGVFYISISGAIYELTCSTFSCFWNLKEQKFKEPRRFGVAMYVPNNVAYCY